MCLSSLGATRSHKIGKEVMAAKKYFTAEIFLKAIPDSGGNITLIAKRVGCHWQTAQRFILDHPTVREAYDSENEAILDIAESLITTNIKLAKKVQETEAKAVDTSDARWWLSKKRKDYKESLEISGSVTFDIPDEKVAKWVEVLKAKLNL